MNLGFQSFGEMADLGQGSQDGDEERGWSKAGVFFPLPSSRGTLEWEVAEPEASCKEHSPLSQALCSKALSVFRVWLLSPGSPALSASARLPFGAYQGCLFLI